MFFDVERPGAAHKQGSGRFVETLVNLSIHWPNWLVHLTVVNLAIIVKSNTLRVHQGCTL